MGFESLVGSQDIVLKGLSQFKPVHIKSPQIHDLIEDSVQNRSFWFDCSQDLDRVLCGRKTGTECFVAGYRIRNW